MRTAVGFRTASPKAYRTYNFTVAFALLVLAAPTLIVISLFLAITQGPKIIYRGPRIGKDQREFHILKFRTLCPHRAKLVTADRTLPADANIETPLGKFLRETRLDELPQLLNILMGDMNICGPRPVRAEIAEIERRRTSGYDTRFDVRPGLIGPTQACFGHSASKRLRARMNNLAVRRPVDISAELALLGRIGLSILERLSGKAMRILTRKKMKSTKDIWIENRSFGERMSVHAIDLKTVRIARPNVSQGIHYMVIRLQSGAVRQARVELQPTSTNGVFSYQVVDEIGAYIIERYALGRVVIPPRVAYVAMAETTQSEMVGQEMGV